jgi:hypothetical protein
MAPQWIDDDKLEPWTGWDGTPAPLRIAQPPASPEPDPDAEAAIAPAPSVPSVKTIEWLRRECLRRGMSAGGDRVVLEARLDQAAESDR